MANKPEEAPVLSTSAISSVGVATSLDDDETYLYNASTTLRRVSARLFSKNHLDRKLERPQLTAIAFAGTIGIGSLNTTGEMIKVSGSLGDMLAYLIAGIIVICVMRSLAEMVSVRPVEGALMDYPARFVDEALGFAVGVIYCAAECISAACLTAGAARTANNFSSTHSLSKSAIAGIIVSLWLVNFLSNICGVKLYGNLERVVKHVKLWIVISLSVLMIIILAGVGNYSSKGYSRDHLTFSFPPGLKFDGFNFDSPDSNSTGIDVGELSSSGIPGNTGRFLSLWTAITFAIFACQGGDLVIVAAGEAKHPRRDLPPVTRFMYMVPICIYIVLALLVGLIINYKDPELYTPWQHAAGATFPSSSPFILVLQRTTLAPGAVPKLFNALFLFAAYTAGNTAIYAASRTLYSLSREYGPLWMKETVGKTSQGNTPQVAIVLCCTISLLAFLGLTDDSFNQPILSLSSFFSSGLACVYACECFAFLRFKRGLKHLANNNDLSRDDKEYTRDYNYYRAHWQPTCAIVGMVGCILVVIFFGWAPIYLLARRHEMTSSHSLKADSDLGFDILGAYLAPVLFLTLFLGYKLYYRTKLVNLRSPDLRYLYFLNIGEEKPFRDLDAKRNFGWWVKEIWGFLK